MFIPLATITLALSLMQQLGLVLGVGAETILLLMRVSGVTRQESDPREQRFVHSIPLVRDMGIVLLIISVIAVTSIEYSGHHLDIIFTPAYLSVCALTALVFLFTIVTHGDTFVESFLEGISGATWYALLLMHVLAPALSWNTLLDAYGVWIAVWAVSWVVILLFASRNASQQSFTSTPQPSMFSKIPHFSNLGVFALQSNQHWLQPAAATATAVPLSPSQAELQPTTSVIIPDTGGASAEAITHTSTPMPSTPPPPPTLTQSQESIPSDSQGASSLRAINVMPRTPSEIPQ